MALPGVATTLAAAKYGGRVKSSEFDVSNVFLSTGLVGGVLYVLVVALALLAAFRYWWRTRSLVALALLGILVVTFGAWLNGGQYAVAALAWFCIGALDRFQMQRRE